MPIAHQTHNGHGPSDAELPVCIVGAGPTSLTVARELEAKGISVVIFEKEPEAGGK
jgi:NADPH-dependent glutamate synthase beta subunit-like oxidoreductase